MSRRTIVFCMFALLAAALFVRLGAWQLARLHEKVQRNAAIAAQQRQTPVPLAALPPGSAPEQYRTISLSGRFDYDHELVLSGRTHQGSPGVDLITPLRVKGSDMAVLVDRGWVYSPDASTADRARWREADSATIVGYVELLSPDALATSAASDRRVVRRVSRREIATKIPYPVAAFYVVATGDSADGAHPARHALPPLDEGPHRSYAIQWFSFAAIAIAGAGLVVQRERRAAAKPL